MIMNQLQDKTLSEIVSEHNGAAAIFEKYHLDYCCKGDETLLTAIANAEIALSDLLTELELEITNESPDNINFNELNVTELSELLRRDYHMELRDKISEISAMSRKIHAKYSNENINRIHDVILAMFNHLAPHMVSEEKVLFPYLEYMEHTVLKGKVPKPASFGKIKKSVSSMLDDHGASAHQLDELRELTNNYTCSQPDCSDIQEYYDELHLLDRNLRMHIFIENNVLFKKARAMEEEFMRHI